MRLGILAGTFDPVHKGHMAFAKQALIRHELDKIIFMPEHYPRFKKPVAPFNHRLAMLKMATADEPRFDIYDSREDFFRLADTIPKLEKKYRESHFVIMIGSDAGRHLTDWEGINLLKAHITFLIALRDGDSEISIRNVLAVPTIKPRVNYSHSLEPTIAASGIRAGDEKTGLAPIDKYIKDKKLY